MRITPIWRSTLALGALWVLGACMVLPEAKINAPIQDQMLQSHQPRALPVTGETGAARLSDMNRAFALDVFNTLGQEGGNLFFSPYNLSISLAMVETGARGETRAEMDRVLHFNLPPDRMHSAFNALQQQVEQSTAQSNADGNTSGFQLHNAAALWGQKGLTARPEYLDLLSANYGTGLHTLDFASDPEGARQVINDWASQTTSGKIPEMLMPGSIDPQTKLALTGAIYFKASWAVPFSVDFTQERPFTLPNGDILQTPMMDRQGADMRYASENGWQLVEVPYASSTVSMDLLLPPAGQKSVPPLDEATLSALLSQNQEALVHLVLPRFTIDAHISLQDTLAKLGMTQAFDQQQADFSGIDGQRDLYLGHVGHQAIIRVDENGTEAVAATGITIPSTGGVVSEPVTVTFDRPFAFLIREKTSGAVLFMGRVERP